MRPAVLNNARTDTAAPAAADVMPIMSVATADAWEIIIIPLKAPQVSRIIMI